MANVLLFSINQCNEPYPVFPLGLAHIDAALRRAGYKTEWFDYQVDNEPLRDLIQRTGPDYIGISLRNIDDVVIKKRETYFGELIALCRELRSLTACPVILGGSGFSIFPERLLALSAADFGIHGQGEQSFVELLDALAGKRDYSVIPGLVYRSGNQVIVNPQRCKKETAISLPERPTRLADFYLRKSSMLNVQTQRGCAYKCCYCTYPVIEGRHYYRRDPEEVAEEFVQLQRSGAKYVFIVDSVFNSSEAHVTNICEAILRKNVQLRWGCFLRPKNLSARLMHLMARAGLAHIEFGTDSFCDSVLRDYGKHFTFDDILSSSEWARQAKVEYCHFLVCGGPGETIDTLRASFENSRRLKDAVIVALVGMRVYPGTPLFLRAIKEAVFDAAEDFLEPKYYLSPQLTQEAVFSALHEFARQSPNWVVGDPSPTYLQMAERLRDKGVVGPLWSYFATMQRVLGNALVR